MLADFPELSSGRARNPGQGNKLYGAIIWPVPNAIYMNILQDQIFSSAPYINHIKIIYINDLGFV